MVLIFEEIRDPLGAMEGRIDRRWAVRLTEVSEMDDSLDATPLYEVAWAEDDALPFSFVVSRRVDEVLVENISIARGNVVLADHGLTVEDDPADPSLAPRQAPLDSSTQSSRSLHSGRGLRPPACPSGVASRRRRKPAPGARP
jgi:hypothetical protein